MKWVSQFFIIIGISFLGETLRHLVPLTIPAGIYGLVIMFVLLNTGIVRLPALRKRRILSYRSSRFFLFRPGSG